MGIKVKHDGNATAAAFASAAGGQGKRAQQDAAQMSSIMQQAATSGNQQLRGATAPAATPGRTSAPIINAPVSAGHAPAGVGGSRASGSGSASGSAAGGDYKNLGGDRTSGAPTADAFWSENSKAWMRPWKPGEKEAEVLDRQLAVKDKYAAQAAEREQQQVLSKEGRAEMAALNKDIATAVMSGRFSPGELDALAKETDATKKRMMFADAYREKEPTAEEAFKKNTYTDANGVVFSRDGSKLIYDPKAGEEKRQAAEDLRYQNALLKMGQGYTTTEEQREDNGDGTFTVKKVNVHKQYTPEEQDAMLKQMFPGRYAQGPTTGLSQPVVVSPFDPIHPNYPAAGNPAALPQPAAAPSATPAAGSGAPVSPENKWGAYRN